MLIAIFLLVLICIGGTFALWAATNMNVFNGSYNGKTGIFNIASNVTSIGEGQTLFQTATYQSGVSSNVTVKRTGDANALGELILHLDATTSTVLTQTVNPHCENAVTLETYSDDISVDTCSGTWVESGTALKYAVLDGSTIVSVGNITSDFIDADTALYEGFAITSAEKTYTVYIWLDGWLADSSYIDLPLNGFLYVKAIQTD